MTVDGREVHKQLNTDIRLVNDGTVYVGGAPDPYSLTKHRIRYNFNGEVVLVCNSLSVSNYKHNKYYL